MQANEIIEVLSKVIAIINEPGNTVSDMKEGVYDLAWKYKIDYTLLTKAANKITLKKEETPSELNARLGKQFNFNPRVA